MSDSNKAAFGITKENMLFTLPPGLRRDESTGALAAAAAEVLAARLEEVGRARLVSNIDGLEEAVLDILARDFKVDWWDPDYSLEEKRRVFKGSWYVHKHMGTKAAVETAVRAVYPSARVSEWFEYEGGRPYHFRLYIDLSDTKGDKVRPWHVLERVEYYKSLRSHLDDLQFTVEAPEPARLHMGGGAGVDSTLGQREGEDVDLLYGTLGDYRQPVPKYSPAYPPSVFNLPLVLVLSSDINAQVSATAGLVTYEELAEITGKLAVRVLGLSIPSEGWRESAGGRYPYSLDLPLEEATLEMAPFATVLEEGEETAENCGLSPRAETVPGAVRFYTVAPPESDIPISLALLRDSTGIVLSAPGGGGGLDLPLATKDAPGMVKPGRGLLVAGDGTLSVDVAEQGEIDEMLAGLDGGEGE